MSWLILPALLGAVALFVVNSIAWMALKHHMSDFRQMPNRDAVEAAFRSVPPGGFYSLPHMLDFPGGCKDPAFPKRYETGPNVTAIVHAPAPCMDPMTFVRGFVLNVLEAAALVVLLRTVGMAADAPTAIAYAAGLGALVRGMGPFTQAVWMRFPWAPAWKVTLDGIAGYAIAAVVIRLMS